MLAGEEVSAGGEQVEAAAAKPSGPKGGKPTATGDGTGMDAAVVIAIEGGGGGTGGAGAGGAGGRPRAAFVPYTPDPSAAVCRDGVGAAGRLTVQSCTARYNAVRNACM